MNRNLVICDGNGCNCERDTGADSRGWLRLMVVGGHPHEVFDFCPSCSQAVRALMPRGPEGPVKAGPLEPAPEPTPELEPHDAPPSTEREP